MQNAVRVRDLFVLTPLQLDELAFSDIVRLLQDGGLPGRHWFFVGLKTEQVAFSLRRMTKAGLVACYADGRVGATPAPVPPLPLMDRYWYGLTSKGRERLVHPAPWDYPLDQWSFPPESTWLHSFILSIRTEPADWVISPVESKRSGAKYLTNCMSYKSQLQKIGQKTRIMAHAIERSGNGDQALLHGHFRPPYDEHAAPVPSELGIYSTVDEDRMVLDVLSDDVENVAAILNLLNHDLATYQKERGDRLFSVQEVLSSLSRLVAAGKVIPFREESGRLVRTSSRLPQALEDYWFMHSVRTGEEGFARSNGHFGGR